MKKIVFLVSLAAWSHHLVCDIHLRIINGTTDASNQFPFVVSLESFLSLRPGYEMFRLCTGSLISANWVLTAGHCIVLQNVLIIRYGDLTVPRNEMKTYGVAIKRLSHPNFRGKFKVVNDIGLIKTHYVNIDVLGRVSAVDFKTLIGLPVTYAGFGLTYTLDKDTSANFAEQDMLKPLQLGASIVTTCPQFPRDMMWSPSLCVRPKCSDKYHESTYGDSGGPLLHDGKIVAVTSGGIPGNFSVLTPVSPYLAWIRQTMSSK